LSGHGISSWVAVGLTALVPGLTGAPEEPWSERQQHGDSGLTYVRIPPGEFVADCRADDPACREGEKPLRRVRVRDGFWMTATEVHVGAFRRFTAATGYRTAAERRGVGGVLGREGWENREGASWRAPGFDQNDDHPVVLVSWADARRFCTWAGGRLPTGTEWAYAAHGGDGSARFVWGDEPAPVVDGRRQANVADLSAMGVSVPEFDLDYDDGAAFTAPVARYVANGFGLYDMAGNVLEWTADSAATNRRIARGGAWNNPPELTRISRHSPFPAAAVTNLLGFRCARDHPPQPESAQAGDPGTFRIVDFPSPDGGTVRAEEYGGGEHAVVLAPGGRFGRGSWSPQSIALAEAGLRVLAMDFRGRGGSRGGPGSDGSDDELPRDLEAAVRYLRSSGARKVSVVGGSLGGWAAAEAAATGSATSDRLVLLAAPSIEEPGRLPPHTMFVVARDDRDGSGMRRLEAIRQQHAAAPEPKELVVLEGSAHAQHVFDTPGGQRLLQVILRFLTAP